MFKWLKADPVEKLTKEYHAKLEQAMESQRRGDIRRYAELTQEAELMSQSIESLEVKRSKNEN